MTPVRAQPKVTLFAQLLRRYRTKARLTQESLSERAGMTPRGLAYLESGQRLPHRGTVSRLADALRLNEVDRQEFESSAQESNATYTDELSRLTLPVTPIIGRERELADVISLVRRDDVRLLTITGVGGVGKTRLAVGVVDRMLSELPDGAVSVALETIRDPDLVIYAVARALGLREAPAPTLVKNIEHSLRGKRTLLFLDNFEQVLKASWLMPEILSRLPQLKALVTSRSPLRVDGEHEYQLSPLAVPDPNTTGVGDIYRSSAVELFMTRAGAIDRELVLDEASGPLIADLTRRLAGLPLAIELAAAQLRVLSVLQLATRLDQRLPVTGGVAAPDRHKTLSATLEWSYDLLTEPERSLFRRLAVFAGQWTLEAVESITDRPDAIDLLAGLIGQSLVIAERYNGMMRYRMLEPVHEYARQRLDASADAKETSERHADYFLALAEHGESELSGARQAIWLDRFESELPNFRAALIWLTEVGDPNGKGLRLARSLWRFWWLRGYVGEGRAHLATLLAVAGTGAPNEQRTRALHTLGLLALRQGDTAEAQQRFEDALHVAEAEHDRPNMAASLTGLGRLAYEEGRYSEAQALFERSLQLDAETPLGESPSLTHTYLGWAALAAGDYARSEEVLGQGLALSHRAEDRDGEGRVIYSLGRLALERGDLDVANSMFVEALKLDTELGYKHGVAMVLEGLADLAEVRGHHERALRLGGATAALRKAAGTVSPRGFRLRHDEKMAAAAAAVGQPEADATWIRGGSLNLQEAAAEGLNSAE